MPLSKNEMGCSKLKRILAFSTEKCFTSDAFTVVADKKATAASNVMVFIINKYLRFTPNPFRRLLAQFQVACQKLRQCVPN